MKRTNNLIENRAKELNRQYKKKRHTQMVNKHENVFNLINNQRNAN